MKKRTDTDIKEQAPTFEELEAAWRRHMEHVERRVREQAPGRAEEAARLARSNIRPVEEYKAADFDGLLFSGGYGVAKNLCDYAYKGADMEVQSDVARAIVETREAGKPLGGMCIAPVMFAKLLPGVCVTLGSEGTPDADNIRKMGAFHVQTEHGDVCADNELLVFTTPAYMLDATLKDVYDGAYNLVEAIIETLDGKRE